MYSSRNKKNIMWITPLICRYVKDRNSTSWYSLLKLLYQIVPVVLQCSNELIFIASFYRSDHTHTIILIVLGFNETSTNVGHFVLSPREREKRDRRDRRGYKREGQVRKRNRNDSEETE